LILTLVILRLTCKFGMRKSKLIWMLSSDEIESKFLRLHFTFNIPPLGIWKFGCFYHFIFSCFTFDILP
jgi:hypothetical protein